MLVSALLASSAAGIIYLAHYQPLLVATGGYSVRGLGADLGQFTSPPGDSFAAYRADYVDGRTITVAFPIDNLGSLPVTVTSVSAQPARDPPYKIVSVQMAPDTSPLDMPGAADYVPFRPFRLAPPDLRQVLIVARLAHGCPPTPDSEYIYSVFSSIRVGFRAFFIQRSASLYLPYSIEIRLGDC